MKKFLVILFLFFFVGIFCSFNSYAQKTGFVDNSRISTKIVGGYEAQPGVWPWMVGLIGSTEPAIFDGQYCGGALISSKWVLTAAHCVEEKSISDLYVVSGIHDLVNDIGTRLDVKKIVQHPAYNSDTDDNDFALLELKENAPQIPVPIYSGLPSAGVDTSLTGEIATIIGWGTTSPSWSIYPERLQQVELPVISNTLCSEAYQENSLEITDNMICAGYSEGGKDSCAGDSGGPLMVWIDGQWVHAGVISKGQGCAQPGFYGINARSSEALEFIRQYVVDASFVPLPEPILPEPRALPAGLLLLLLK